MIFPIIPKPFVVAGMAINHFSVPGGVEVPAHGTCGCHSGGGLAALVRSESAETQAKGKAGKSDGTERQIEGVLKY